MAHAFPPPAVAGLSRTLRDLGRKLSENSRGYACAREAERLSRLSDAELAELGLTRDRIFRHAFARFLAH